MQEVRVLRAFARNLGDNALVSLAQTSRVMVALAPLQPDLQ